MRRVAEQAGSVTGGVDAHADVHVAAVAGRVGRVLGTQAFPATAAGYRAALARVGVEGTGSYGAGLARYLAGCGVAVAEGIRPNRQARRRRVKSDAADAVAAAVATLSGEASGLPKSRDGAAESIRALKVARAGAIKVRTQAGNQLRDLILTAPEPLRQRLAGLPSGQRADVAARFRPGDPACPAEGAKAAMASVARRHQQLTAEITRLDAMLGELVPHAAPAQFLAKKGVATQVTATLLATAGDNPGRVRKEASFAALCGASPVDACSGKHLRHRLNRGGDRQANSALWTIAMTRLACDPRTKAYAAGRTAEGKTNKEIIRCLKRYIARETYKALCRPQRPGMPSAPKSSKIFQLRS
jgi:transposase